MPSNRLCCAARLKKLKLLASVSMQVPLAPAFPLPAPAVPYSHGSMTDLYPNCWYKGFAHHDWEQSVCSRTVYECIAVRDT